MASSMCNKIVCICAFCRYCFNHNLLSDKLGENTFVTEGFNNWKKASECFERHEKSGLHRETVVKIEMLWQPGIDTHLDTLHAQSLKTRQDNLLTLLSSMKYLFRQGLAIRGHENLEGNLMQLLLIVESKIMMAVKDLRMKGVTYLLRF